ncbi:MAG: hypothetical protein AMS27_04125 [Bacteroides sp. SM23_62_1]|nr:MAG: hypothetical protein AMS27_04125 [Bacteroides sp. SM23_62_1]
MKKLIILFISGLFALNVLAQDHGFGIGIILGEPTGISAKNWISSKTAVDAAVAWSLYDPSLHIHADFLLHNFNLISVSKGQLPVYFGLGARIRLADETNFGARIPVGIDYHFEGAPLDIFFEVVPILNFVPTTAFDLNAAIGMRYFF